MGDPFNIQGPALISFSGGRTSGYMLWRILQAHGGTLPDDVRVTFANTGKEMPQTLDFVRDCGERWGVLIHWLEYRDHDEPKYRWQQVSYDRAARKGEPFTALNKRQQALPNPGMGWCTTHLKIRPMKLWSQQVMGWDHWSNVVGIRADEPPRIVKMRHSADEQWDNVLPLVSAGVTKPQVLAHWGASNFDLALPPGWGNCDLCWKKGIAQIQAMMRDIPGVGEWWVSEEDTPRASKPLGALFRSDRPSYAEMFKAVQEQRNFDFGDRDELTDCFCGDGT